MHVRAAIANLLQVLMKNNTLCVPSLNFQILVVGAEGTWCPELPCVQSYPVLPRVQSYPVLPRVQSYPVLPRVQSYPVLPHVQSYPVLPRVQSYPVLPYHLNHLSM